MAGPTAQTRVPRSGAVAQGAPRGSLRKLQVKSWEAAEALEALWPGEKSWRKEDLASNNEPEGGKGGEECDYWDEHEPDKEI